jgi:RimJ/RimL family protein N-acetyltransferase
VGVVLETERLILRHFVPEDLDALAAILGDPVTMRFYPQDFDRDASWAWLESQLTRYERDGVGLWAMDLRDTGELIGDCGLAIQALDGRDETEIGWHVRRELWGRGLATEGGAACRDWGFANRDVDRLISIILPENLQSRRVAEKIGMRVGWETTWAGLPHLIHVIDRPQDAR